MDQKSYKKSLNLPQTKFPMRANLSQKEPDILKFWQKIGLYKKLRLQSKGKPKFILHDGPPYANGDIHLGHTRNKILKDMIVRFKSMAGYDSPYVPGWDTHGLPIEQQTIKNLNVDRHQIDDVKFRRICRDYALKYINIQKKQFKRLGVEGDWENPYLTLEPAYEAVQIGVFGELAKKGYIYKGLKPVYWCSDCETALAEAEVEYQEKESPSIYVKFPVIDSKGLFPIDNHTYVLIWTTTPWTIPGNMAISLHPNFTYVLTEVDGEKLLIAEGLLSQVLAHKGKEKGAILGKWKGLELENLRCKHPFYQRESILILGEHVTLEQGTGAVHTAPAHGMDDFIVCQRYGVPMVSLVNGEGRFTDEAGPFSGMLIWEANKEVIAELKKKNLLYHDEIILHQYPHCWRCKSPLFFRATEQWFTRIDGFRSEALKEIDQVEWIPAWGKERIYNMVAERGDWCISRQRLWGVPIPIFYCKSCEKPVINDQTITHLQQLFREHGSDVWYAKNVEELLPPNFTCPYCGNSSFTKETDTMDVWFDSGSSHFAVLECHPDLKWPAELYLEGIDQHRGWFNSSLCTSVAIKGKAPYRAVLTHGFVVDEDGHKMSKSQGNVIDPQELIKKYGADVLRLWVASGDYRTDVSISQQIINQAADTYRKIRNTFRFMLGNLYDFDPVKDAIEYEKLGLIERGFLLKLHQLIQRVTKGYNDYDFHIVYHAIYNFCVVDLSSFYLDITKDALYCNHPASEQRRAIQTVLYETANILVRLLAPVLSFTAEEIWSYLPGIKEQESVHLAPWPMVNRDYLDKELEAKWTKISKLRDEVAKAIEATREQKLIGPSSEACVVFYPEDEKEFTFLKSIEEELALILIVAKVDIQGHWKTTPKTAFQSEALPLKILINKAPGQKCIRCWIHNESVGTYADHPELCERCRNVINIMEKE